MKERRRRREQRLARQASADVRDGEALARKWLAADPAPPEIAQAAKAAFVRHQRTATVLPVSLEIRAEDEALERADDRADLLVFGTEQASVEIQVGRGSGPVILHCTLRGGQAEPSAVTAETPSADHPMARSGPGVYRTDGLPHGPVRVAVEFADEPARSVVTSWFTA